MVALGEISSDDSTATVAEYTQPGRLHMGYSFELLSNDSSPRHIRATVENLIAARARELAVLDDLQPRRRARGQPLGSQRRRRRTSRRSCRRWSCSLRGSVCVFQGEELGLGEADVPYEALRDPYGIAFWPTFKGRDGCRTPMPWDASERAGFSNGEPVAAGSTISICALSVAAQERDPTSALHGFRRLLDVARSRFRC